MAMNTEPCFRCHGAGTIGIGGPPCDQCGGEGVLPVADEVDLMIRRVRMERHCPECGGHGYVTLNGYIPPRTRPCRLCPGGK